MNKFPSLTNSRPCFREIKPKLNPNLEKLGEPHLDSFNHMLDSGLKLCADKVVPVSILTPDGERLCFKVEDIMIGRPSVPFGVIDVKDRRIYPAECRQRNCSYSGMCTVRVSYSLDGIKRDSIEVELGEVPVMIKSKACNLNEMEPEKLVKHGEHDSEWGGFFIIKGNEKIIRMLLMSRRNYPIVLKRSSWKDRGQNFSEFGVMVRSVGNDEQSFNNVLHYLNNGTAKFMFSQNKFLSYIPVCLVLKTLVDLTDEKIYESLIRGYEHDKYYLSCIQNMLREVHVEGLNTHSECKNYLGEIFRSRFPELPSWASALDITEFIIKERILIHLDSNKDKFNFIVFMVQKLFQCVQDKFKIENVDSVMMQEVLLGGQLYQKYVADRINLWLSYVKRYVVKKFDDNSTLDISSSFITTALKSAGGISKAIDSFLATGNIASRSGLGLMQSSGLVVMAENINRMRYMSHFRAVHRGSFFVTMRTTEARQLLPDAWGFICPVHTPDGTPCGLLNHLTVNCKISTREDPKSIEAIPLILTQCGMIPLDSPIQTSDKLYIVQLEGCILGHIRQVDGTKIVEKLRLLKINGSIPKMTEIAFVPYKEKGQFPGLFLFVGPSRMMRPVKNIKLDQIEYIGSMEQVYMDIAVDENEIYPNITTHLELTKIDFMSNLANLIPMPDLNQSPRNMYQCQMGKQTMGTPCLNWSKQAGTKLYRLQTPGTPLFRPVHHDNIDLDDFAMGTSAIVAVISYTGYDMEDAMIINKFAHERGFAYGTIYKSSFVELQDNSYFARNPKDPTLAEFLDNDGLPHPGTKIRNRSILYCYFDTNEALYKVVRSKDKEEGIVDSVKYCGTFKASSPKTICITLRIPRPANIGDKFASRAGQKGICSQKYPAEDLPFSETGLIPDIVFNPHGFPSRMTIAMMVETMAGKSASLHGLVHDATPFTFSEKHTAIDYFGKLLEMGGYNYYGTERLYSGVDGREMTADIFMGVVYYQRLRHMVFDKWQVRSTGPVDAITHQPIKGRKYGGGIRFGEMERDALISHGASFLLQDRLFHNSDKVTELVCNDCGSLLAPGKLIIKTSKDISTTRPICRICQGNTKCSFIEVPMAYKHLVTELSSININARFKFTDI